MRRQHLAQKACVSVSGWQGGWGEGMCAGRDTICSPEGLSAASLCSAFEIIHLREV